MTGGRATGGVKGGSKAGSSGGSGFERSARFGVGQIVNHVRFDYRGVIVDVDACFSLSDEWYDEVARSRPPKDRPWYHVLVSNSQQVTYVAERHLEADESGEPIRHPLLGDFFEGFEGGHYLPSHKM